MAKKIVELKSKKKIELNEMSIDDVDFCNDLTVLQTGENGKPFIICMSKARTAWLRRGIKGGDFKSFKKDPATNLVADSVLKQLTEDEKNELLPLIQEYQSLGE